MSLVLSRLARLHILRTACLTLDLRSSGQPDRLPASGIGVERFLAVKDCIRSIVRFLFLFWSPPTPLCVSPSCSRLSFALLCISIMKILICVLTLAVVAQGAPAPEPHYAFPNIIGTKEWEDVWQWTGYTGHGSLFDVPLQTSDAITRTSQRGRQPSPRVQ